jgi:hypothetical protein
MTNIYGGAIKMLDLVPWYIRSEGEMKWQQVDGKYFRFQQIFLDVMITCLKLIKL